MEISQEEVEKLVESQTVELKKSLSELKEGCETLCGMINSDITKGKVIFGVSPDGKPCGIDPGNLDSAQRTIAQHIKQKFDPPIICIIEVLEFEDMHLLQVKANRMSGIAYHEYGGRAYIREGTTTRQLSHQEKQHLLKKRDRDHHNGPWKCDRCGSFVGMLVSVELTEQGMKKNYKCHCGGEYWPAT
jgi:ATP-dependent DNA helicase RecG